MAHEPTKRISNYKRGKIKGRSQFGPPFIRLYRFMVESEAFATLSPIATKLLIDIAAKYNGYNNGDLSAAWSIISKRGWASENTMRRALKQLVAKGFLICTRHGNRKRCSLFAITWEPLDECQGEDLEVKATRTAGHDWRNQNSTGGCKPPAPTKP